MTALFNPGNNKLINVDGHLVEADALRVVESLKAYDPDIEVLCLKPEMAGAGDEPFQVCYNDNGQLRKIFGCWELNGSLLDRLRACDTKRNNLIAVLDGMEVTIQNENEHRYREEREQDTDLVLHVVRNRRSRYSFRDRHTDDMVTVFDDRPSERK